MPARFAPRWRAKAFTFSAARSGVMSIRLSAAEPSAKDSPAIRRIVSKAASNIGALSPPEKPSGGDRLVEGAVLRPPPVVFLEGSALRTEPVEEIPPREEGVPLVAPRDPVPLPPRRSLCPSVLHAYTRSPVTVRFFPASLARDRFLSARRTR